MPNREYIDLRFDLHMSAESGDAEIMVYGSIVSRKWDDRETNTDMTAKEFDKLLKEAKNSGAKRLMLRINSGGGTVFQAVAMRTMLLSAGFDSMEVRIDGLCASAATLLACVPGSKVSIAEGAMYMIHNPVSAVWGDANAMEHEAEFLRKMEHDVRNIYSQRCGMDESELKTLMDVETWYSAEDAVKAGFADEVLAGEGLAAASADADMIAAMRDMYKHVPEMNVGKNKDSNGEPTVAAGEPSVNNPTHEEDEENMEVKDITLEQLRTENPALHSQIMQAGAEQERERIQEIDDLTPAGYEEMAAQAKANGTSAMDFHKQIVKAHKEKGQAFLAQRKTETAPAAKVKGGASDDKTAEQEMEAHAKEMAALAKEQRATIDGSMY